MSAPMAVEAIEETFDETIETIEAPESIVAREEREAMPLPTEPRTIFLGGLFILALLAALYVASPIVLPVVLAIVLKLFLQPLVRLTDRLGVPHGVGAALAIVLAISMAAWSSARGGRSAADVAARKSAIWRATVIVLLLRSGTA